MLIFLIGMMGSGKTTLGRQLAEELGYTFLDLDACIEQQAGQSVTDIFAQQGQERFRELERQALEEVAAKYSAAVVATGGGTPCFFDNMAYMNRHGETVFLNTPISEITTRLLATNLATRPLLSGKSEAEIKAFLTQTFAQRQRFYSQAKHKTQSISITAAHLKQMLNH